MQTLNQVPPLPTAVPLAEGTFVLKLGRFERELAAGRFVRACRKAGTWTGVSEKQVFEDLRTELVQFRAWTELNFQHLDYAAHKRRLFWCNLATLGVWGFVLKLRGKLPQAPKQTLPEEPYHPWGNFGDLAEGLDELIEHGFLRAEASEDPDDRILYATPRLFQHIRQPN